MNDEPKVVELDGIQVSETAWRFEGHEHGSTTSFFVTDHPPGRGPDLHRHPYDENFVVREGRARFTVGEETIEAVPGQVVIVPPNTWHGFKAAGEENLKMVCIHPTERMEQEEFEEAS